MTKRTKAESRRQAEAQARQARQANDIYSFYGTKQELMELWNTNCFLHKNNPKLTMADMDRYAVDGTLVHLDGEDYHLGSIWAIHTRLLTERLEASITANKAKAELQYPDKAVGEDRGRGSLVGVLQKEGSHVG